MEGFSMLVDIETTKDQLSQVAVSLKQHISFNKRHYGDCIEYSSFLRSSTQTQDGDLLQLQSERGGFDVDWCGRTMLHDVVTRAMNEAGISFTLPDFHMLGNLRVKPEKWTIWIIKNTVAEDRMFNGTRGTLNPFGFGNEGGDRQCIQNKVYGRVRTSTRSDYKLKSKYEEYPSGRI
jgi:hypothetical protein